MARVTDREKPRKKWPREAGRLIAARYLPNRTHYYYARCKLALDPLYGGVCDALTGAVGNVLDLGCGIGLLAHALRANGLDLDYVGVDRDSGKIEAARRSMAHAQGDDAGRRAVNFSVCDLAADFPAWQGHVVLLDLLQYVPPLRQPALLGAAMNALGPGCRLVIRTGLESSGLRSRLNHLADEAGHALRWMNEAPQLYPRRAALLQELRGRGLDYRIEPLRAGTPFDNWLVVAQRAAPARGQVAAAD